VLDQLGIARKFFARRDAVIARHAETKIRNSRQGDFSELSRQVAVNLETDADFDENRCGPSHRILPLRLFVLPLLEVFSPRQDPGHPILDLGRAL
jgi:hypothetical protein